MCIKSFPQYNIELIKLYKSNSNSSTLRLKQVNLIELYCDTILDRDQIFINQTLENDLQYFAFLMMKNR